MTMKIIRGRNQRRQTGFGIIEIMIALVLGIIIMLGVTQIATNNSNTRYELDRSGRQIENAAFALSEIENDLTNSAFWGERGAKSPEVALPPVCPNDIAELEQAMGYPVQGGQGEFDCDVVDPPPPATKITPKAGTNYLAIRRANSCASIDIGCEPAGANYHIKVHACFNQASTDKPGDFDIFSSSEVSAETYTKRDCDTDAPEYRLLNRIYYINEDDQLMRAELVGTAYEESVLVDGVEWMRFEYGMDRSTVLPGDIPAFDGQVDDDINGFTPVPTSDLNTDPPTENAFPDSAWSDVVMVRISLVVRNTEPSNGFVDYKVYTIAREKYCVEDHDDHDDHEDNCDVEIPTNYETYRRQVYSRTVSLRNVAGRRQVE